MTINLAVFCASVLAIGIGLTFAIGWAWALVSVGAIFASVTLLATLKGK